MNIQSFTNQMRGYDRSNTMFTPDGRLIQVEYAKKTVNHGSTAIGIVCKDGVLIVVDKGNDNNLLVGDFTEKIIQIDDHIGVALAGMLSDGRILVEKSQLKAQIHRVTYDSPIGTISIVKDICEVKAGIYPIWGLKALWC